MPHRLLTDEDFCRPIVTALVGGMPGLDVTSVCEVGLSGAPDADVLAWAADEQRILLTHDRRTMPQAVEGRLAGDLPVPPVILCRQKAGWGVLAEQLQLVLTAMPLHEIEACGLIYLPL